jgi:small ligand-binding sensory domain FIST
MQGDTTPVLEASAVASLEATDALNGAPPLGVLVFDCCVRSLALGERDTDAAAAHLAKTLGSVSFGGFYSNGEIARTSGAKGMHHLTVVALAVS